MRKARLALLGALLAAGTAASAGAEAATLEPVGSANFSAPTFVTSDPRNPDRLFVTEQAGTITEVTPGDSQPFLDLTAEVLDGGERGLWSMAFAPEFAEDGRFYVAYSAADGALTLDEYRERANPAATEATRRPVLSIPNSFATSNHNGGQLGFGPDGYLYWSTGDDASGANAQSTANLLGKILRIDPRQNGTDPYTVPADNPFVGVGGARGEIWALGLRNPWRFSFDRATGALVIGDVGAGSWEEVDHVTQAAGGGRGANFGWPTCEALVGTGCAGPGFTPPIYAYANPPSDCAAITGGYVVRDPDLGDLVGRYLFADLCASALRSIDPLSPPAFDGHRVEADLTAQTVTSFGEDACGRVYVVAFGGGPGDGRVFRVEGPSGGACPPGSPAQPDTDPPKTTLGFKAKNKRRSRVVFTIGSDEPGSTFECKLDRRRWRECSAREKVKRLKTGRHKFRARATDRAGNTDPTPAKRGFRVKPRGGR